MLKVTAAVLIIGDEILSGRTQDTNTPYIAKWLNEIGIDLVEVRVVPDVTAEIIAAVNALRGRYTYVFTTGGIGPTHDDITADAIAGAFGVDLMVHKEAFSLLEASYGAEEFSEARQRMARIPEGGILIGNPVSIAPGFQVENVFVMAGVPVIMKAMLESLMPRLEGGQSMLSATVTILAPESQMAAAISEIQDKHQGTSIGSYPFMKDKTSGMTGKTFGCQIVVRSRDEVLVSAAIDDVIAYARAEKFSYQKLN